MKLQLRPWACKHGIPWIKTVHRRLPDLQGAMWCICLRDEAGEVWGVALIGRPSREWDDYTKLTVLRVAVKPEARNGCSMLYGACSKMGRAAGLDDLLTYTHLDEDGASLKASGWIDGGITDGGEHSREKRPRKKAVDALPKRRWYAAWSISALPRSQPKEVPPMRILDGPLWPTRDNPAGAIG